MTIEDKDGDDRGEQELARKARAGHTWLAALVPDALHNAIEHLAHEERRSISNMARLLFEEALRARGIDWEAEAESGAAARHADRDQDDGDV